MIVKLQRPLAKMSTRQRTLCLAILENLQVKYDRPNCIGALGVA